MSAGRFDDQWSSPDVKFGAPPPSEVLQHMPVLEANVPPDGPDVALGE